MGALPVWMVWPVLFACSGQQPSPEATPAPVVSDWGGSHWTQSKKYAITVESEPNPPVMGEFFALKATVTREDGTPVETAEVDLDARMPQHNHGMMTDPVMRPGACAPDPDAEGEELCTFEGGVYWSDGFKFHMGGEWTILIDVKGPIGPDRTTFVYDMQ